MHKRMLWFAVLIQATFLAALFLWLPRKSGRPAPVPSRTVSTSSQTEIARERAARIAAEQRAAAMQDELQNVLSAQQHRLAAERDARRRADRVASRARVEVQTLRTQLAVARQATLMAPPPPPMPAPVAPTETAVETTMPVVLESPEPQEITTEEQECEKDHPCQVKVFFATDRNLVDPVHVPERFRNLKYYFGGDRELDPKVGFRLGECIVTIPTAYYKKYSGKLDYQYAGTYDPQHSVFIKDVTLASSSDWIQALNKRIDADPKREMFVFIHGFNVTFIDAARRTAQIYYDLGFQGAPVFYSWPSGGKLWNYWADEASVEWSEGHLRDFLDLLAKESNAQRIHLIAHSMGNRALTHALAEIGARNAANAPKECQLPSKKFQEVVLAAPDLDTDLFLQLESGIKSAASRVTLYASKRDRAVLASWILHRFRRLGVPGRTAPPDVDAVDATAASSDFLGHSYYGESALWDMKLMFEKPDIPIDRRCTVKRESGAPYYRFLPQPALPGPGKVKRLAKFIFRRRSGPDVITTCPIPTAAPAGGR